MPDVATMIGLPCSSNPTRAIWTPAALMLLRARVRSRCRKVRGARLMSATGSEDRVQPREVRQRAIRIARECLAQRFHGASVGCYRRVLRVDCRDRPGLVRIQE